MPDEDPLILPDHTGGSSEAMASAVDDGILNVALSTLANEATAASSRRTNRFDQLGADSASMWSVALTSPTVSSAMGYRTAIESGSGRTRSETNAPHATGAGGP